MNNDSLFKIQSDVIRQLAENQSCLFVGRCADYILRDHPRQVNIFISASKEARVERLMRLNEITQEKAEEMIASADIKKKKREKMLSLLRLVPKKKSLYQAIKELKLRDVDEILELFAKLNVSPITISKREDISFLENLYNYIEL